MGHARAAMSRSAALWSDSEASSEFGDGGGGERRSPTRRLGSIIPTDGGVPRWDMAPTGITTSMRTSSDDLRIRPEIVNGPPTQITATSPPLSPDGQLAFLRLHQRGSRRRQGAPGHYKPSRSPSPTKLAPIAPAASAAEPQPGQPEEQPEQPEPEPAALTYFISGVMVSKQGKATEQGLAMEPQDYRAQIRSAITSSDPSATIIDPLDLGAQRAAQLHPVGTPESELWRDDADVRSMLAEVVGAAAGADVVVCYLPTASMGSAIELHEARAVRTSSPAFVCCLSWLLALLTAVDILSGVCCLWQAGRTILVVTPDGAMRSNWVVRAYADKVFDSIDAMGEYLKEQRLGKDGRGIGKG